MTTKTMNREVPKKLLEKLKKLSHARSVLYLGGFLTESENESVSNRIMKFRKKELEKVGSECGK